MYSDLSSRIRELTWENVSTEKATEACSTLSEQYAYYSELRDAIRSLKFHSDLPPDQALEICLKIQPDFQLTSQIQDGISKLKFRGLKSEVAANLLMQLKTNFKAVDKLDNAIRDLEWSSRLSTDRAAQLCSKIALCLEVIPALKKSIDALSIYPITPDQASESLEAFLPEVQLCEYFVDAVTSLTNQGITPESAIKIVQKVAPDLQKPNFYKVDSIIRLAWEKFNSLEPEQKSTSSIANLISEYASEVECSHCAKVNLT